LSERGTPGRRSIDRRTAGALAGAAGVLVILAAILGPTALTTHPTATFPSGTQVAAHPTSSHGPGESPNPTEEPQPWADLDVPAFDLAAAFEPNKRDGAGVATDSTFTVRSLTSTPGVALAKGLHIDPPTAFTIKPGASPDLAIVRPSTQLVEGVRYRFRLDAPDGALAGAWAFTTSAPLHVVTTLPGDRSTEVPVNTGVEIEFDQDGTKGVADHVTIEPKVTGRFEQHDRTWAFVPDKPLAPATIYSVTVRAGVGRTDSAETLKSDVRFRFETAAAASGTTQLAFGRSMFEARPGARLIAPMGYSQYDFEDGAPEAATIDVHRLPTFNAILDAAAALAGPDSWALNAPTAVVDTSGMTLVGRVDGKLLDSSGGLTLRLPLEPSAGAYILTIVQSGSPQQMLVQVTNLAAYALTAQQSTVVWVNDLANGSAVAGADVSLARGASLGATDVAGVLRTATPAVLAGGSLQPEFLTIRAPDGRRLVVPVGLPRWSFEGDYEDGVYGLQPDVANWWLLMRTDRSSYRQTDTVNVYGMIRARSDRSVPHGIELRLRPSEGRPDAPIERVPVTATRRGVFTGAIHLDDLPRGDYLVDLWVGAKWVSSAWITVTEIRKPAFRIDVETDRHVYVLGQTINIAATAAFYDGTAVPGMDLRFSAFDHAATATTGAVGDATATLRAASSYVPEGWFTDYIGVAPAHPEEGQISGEANVVLLPARTWLVATGAISSGRVVVNGTLTWADIKGMEATLDAGGELDEADGPGRIIAGGQIRAEVIHLVPVRRQIGTQYDFIEKRVVPVYEYDTREVSLGTSTLTSASDGRFHLSIAAPVATDDYEVRLSAADPEGRRFIRTVYISPAVDQAGASLRPYLQEAPGACSFNPPTQVGVNQPFKVAMHEGTGQVATDGRFLFLVAERGSIETTVQDAATFSRTLRDADLPGFTVRAIWLSDRGFAVADAYAVVDPDTKRLTIKLQPDRSRYQPGQHATISVTTTDPSGHPVAVDVVVQAVDEKLYTQGIASDVDPVPDLMSSTSDGLLQSYTTHDVPYLDEGGCGGTGGGGRDDFRDVVTFQRITTGADGRGSVDFDLSDDLTSWHVTATAFSGALDSGIAAVQLPVGLPFFVDAVLAPEYLVGEEPVLQVRAFGGALVAGTPVTFTVEAPSLGLAPTIVHGTAFEPVRVPMPKLVPGDHRIRVAGEASRSGKTYRDALIRTVHVASSRLAGLAASYDLLDDSFSQKGGEGLTTYSITDAGRGRLVALLQDLASASSGRFDRLAAAEVARRLLIDDVGFSPAGLPATGFDVARYQRDGIALLPYSSTDLFLSARAALVVPNLLDRGWLVEVLRTWADEEQATRERRVVALAGLAGLGEDVLPELLGYDAATLTVREQLWLALGLAAAGDEGAARVIERSLLDTAGQRLGPWVRLATGTTLDDTLEASGLLLLLAGRLGDPLAHEVSSYLLDVDSGEHIFPLEQIGYVSGMLDRLPRESGRFAWTVDGERHEVELQPGGAFTLVLTSQQRATLALERLDGKLAVVTTWTTSDAELPNSSTISVRRTVTPSGDAPDDRLVHVRLEVTFGAQSPPGCYRLVDLTPSGMSAVAATAAWPDEEEESPSANQPYSVVGQRVEWCAGPADLTHVYEYAARVVSPGTYRWEPAVLQFELSPGLGASTPESTYTIR
jgi:alpha-2-macroglobulin